MKNDHAIHVADRILASIMFLSYIWKMSALFFYGRPSTFFGQLSCFAFALFAFMNSQDAQEARDADAFVFWHCLWHIFPFQVMFIEIYDTYVLDEYEIAKEESAGRKPLRAFKKAIRYFTASVLNYNYKVVDEPDHKKSS